MTEIEVDQINKKHTPGPWEPYSGSAVVIRKPNRRGAMVMGQICTVGLSPRDVNYGARQTYPEALAEQAANTNLIAAAPELLASLREMVAELLAHASLGLNADEVAMLTRAQAAIEKATGTKP